MNRSHLTLLTAALGSALALSTNANAADTTLAGWTFSQFISEGYPSVDGSSGDATNFVAATFRGSVDPVLADVDGSITIQSGATGYVDTSFGSWSFANFNVSNASDVRADTLGALNTVNSTTLDGKNMHLTDSAGMMLTFNLKNTLWTITADTAGYENASAADFTYAARGNGGAATVEWLFNGAVFSTETIAVGAFATYSAELPPAFYGAGTIEGRVTAGSVSFDNAQINGTPSAVPEPSSFAALAGLAGLALVGSRRRRA
jgi:hypothetical protein